VMALASSVAQAESSENFGEVSGNVGFASEYIFRGTPSSDGGAQVSGGLDWSKDQYYLGTWVSNVGNKKDNTNENDSGPGSEVDVYGGINVGQFDLGAIAYVFPGAPDARNTKILELFVGYNSGMLSGYAYYGVGANSDSADDYVYLDGTVSGAISDKLDLSAHVGYTIYTGDQQVSHPQSGKMVDQDNQVDLGLTLSMGNFWMGATTIIDNDTNSGANKRPRVNLGYTWTFDNVMDINLSSYK
jgi:uncharacterized protein (TIGR02001 family)